MDSRGKDPSHVLGKGECWILLMQQVAQDVKPWLPVGSSKGKDYLDPSWSFFWQRHFLDQDVHQAKDYNRGVEVVGPHEALLLWGSSKALLAQSPTP